jgi:hypothetical protein
MPWMESSVTEERLRFVARLLDGEAMTDVCRDFGVSRKTGYKIFDRYKEQGLEALSDRSRRPVRYAKSDIHVVFQAWASSCGRAIAIPAMGAPFASRIGMKASRRVFNRRGVWGASRQTIPSSSKRYASGQSCRYIRPRFE